MNITPVNIAPVNIAPLCSSRPWCMMPTMRLLLPLAGFFDLLSGSGPVASKPHPEPHRLEGWTLKWPISR